jgi:hypothetical protein
MAARFDPSNPSTLALYASTAEGAIAFTDVTRAPGS